MGIIEMIMLADDGDDESTPWAEQAWDEDNPWA